MGEFHLEVGPLNLLEQELSRSGIDMKESSLIGVLEDPTANKYNKYWATIALRNVGTEKSILALKKMVDYPMADVKDCAVLTIAEISGKDELPFLIELLSKPKFSKGYTLWAILSINDDSALNAVKSFMTLKLKYFRRQSVPMITGGLQFGLIYLDQFRSDPEIQQLLNGYKLIWDKFAHFDQKRLIEKTEFFSHQQLRDIMDQPGKKKEYKRGMWQRIFQKLNNYFN